MGVNLVQKLVNSWDTSEMKELVYYNVKTLTWDTSEMKELVDQGVQGALLIPTEPIVPHRTTRRLYKK